MCKAEWERYTILFLPAPISLFFCTRTGINFFLNPHRYRFFENIVSVREDQKDAKATQANRRYICHREAFFPPSRQKDFRHTWHYASSEGGLAGEEVTDGTGPGEAEGWCLKK